MTSYQSRRRKAERDQVANIATTAAAITAVDSQPISHSGRGATKEPIRDRSGWNAIGYASAALGISRSVPDEFRKLAERDL
jgi:hypothetical protein